MCPELVRNLERLRVRVKGEEEIDSVIPKVSPVFNTNTVIS